MIDLFQHIYSSIPTTYRTPLGSYLYSALRFTTRVLANAVLPLYLRLTQHNPSYRLTSTGEPKILVSLTSFPARIDKVWMVIESILRQSTKPDCIILWLAREQFPTLNHVPSSLRKLQNRGLTIQLCDRDIRSHKKYYYALQQYPLCDLITIDDDIFYPSDILACLVEAHTAHPQAIIASYAHEILFDQGKRKPYLQWRINIPEFEALPNLFFGSGGGTYFPAHSLHPDVLNETVFMSICPHADDVWLNAMAHRQGTEIIRSRHWGIVLPILSRNTPKLSTSNMESGNDIQLSAVESYLSHNNNENNVADPLTHSLT